MSGPLARAVAAELAKLVGLPSIVATAAGTVATGAVLGAALASSAPNGTSSTAIVELTIPFVQVGLILLGVLTVGSEYAGRQIATSLVAMPDRPAFLTAKALTHLLISLATSAATVGALAGSAHVALALRGFDAEGTGWRTPLGAVVYLVLIGLFALALSILLRSLLAPLVTALSLVLIVSPLLSGQSEHARWLPDRAGSLLYRPGADAVLTEATGTLVLLAWIMALAVPAAWAFLARDA